VARKRAGSYATAVFPVSMVWGQPGPRDVWWDAYGNSQFDELVEEGSKGAPNLAQAARLHNSEAVAHQRTM